MTVTETPAAPAWDAIHGLRGTNFGDLASEALSLAQTIRELQTSLDEKKVEMKAHMEHCLAQAVMVDGLRVTLVKGRAGSRKLDPVKLLKNGVKQNIIEACYTEGKPGAPYLKLTSREEEGEAPSGGE